MYKTEVLHAIVAVFVYIFISTSKANAVEVSPIFGIGQENFTFELSEFDPNDKNKKINFAPNIAGIAKLGINAYGFGVGYSFRGAEKDINQNKGTTKFDDWQLAYNSKNWGIETFYQTYTGFYTENTNAIQVNPNLTLRRIGITARYALGDEEFSVGALMDQTSRIKETSGKYYLIAGYDDHTLKTDSSLLIQENAGVDPTLESLRQLKANDLKFGVGAGKYWVFAESFFAGGMIDLLSTYANYKYETTGAPSTESNSTTSINFRLALGYTRQNVRTGISIASDSTTLKTNSSAYVKPSANKILIYIRLVDDF